MRKKTTKLKKIAKSGGWLCNHLLSMSGNYARNHLGGFRVKDGDEIVITIRRKNEVNRY
jgi:hypothetical protein